MTLRLLTPRLRPGPDFYLTEAVIADILEMKAPILRGPLRQKSSAQLRKRRAAKSRLLSRGGDSDDFNLSSRGATGTAAKPQIRQTLLDEPGEAGS